MYTTQTRGGVKFDFGLVMHLLGRVASAQVTLDICAQVREGRYDYLGRVTPEAKARLEAYCYEQAETLGIIGVPSVPWDLRGNINKRDLELTEEVAHRVIKEKLEGVATATKGVHPRVVADIVAEVRARGARVRTDLFGDCWVRKGDFWVSPKTGPPSFSACHPLAPEGRTEATWDYGDWLE